MSRISYDAAHMRITVDDTEVRKALGDLSSKTPAVMKVAVNRTAREARKLMIKSAQKRYDLSAKGKEKVKGLKQRGKATNANPAAELFIGGGSFGVRNDLAYFRTDPKEPFMGHRVWSAPKYFRARVLKKSAMKNLTGKGNLSKGFLVQFKSGHIGMVQRVAGTKGPDYTQKGLPRWQPSNKLQTMGAPSAVAMHRTVWKDVEPDVETILEESLERRIQQILAKAKGAT